MSGLYGSFLPNRYWILFYTHASTIFQSRAKKVPKNSIKTAIHNSSGVGRANDGIYFKSKWVTDFMIKSSVIINDGYHAMTVRLSLVKNLATK